MHYGVLVIIENGKEPEEAVAEVLEPHGDGKEWDWYQIGGRWTGHFDGYEPEKDPDNIKECRICKGTKVYEEKECYNCRGTGLQEKWPTDWKRHDGDIIPLAQVTEEHYKVYAVVDRYNWHGSERYEPWHGSPTERFVKTPLPPLEWLKKEYPNAMAVIVDCHN